MAMAWCVYVAKSFAYAAAIDPIKHLIKHFPWYHHLQLHIKFVLNQILHLLLPLLWTRFEYSSGDIIVT
jgi:hypothetical protein